MLTQDHVTNGMYLADRFLWSSYAEDAMETAVSPYRPSRKLSDICRLKRVVSVNHCVLNLLHEMFIFVFSIIFHHWDGPQIRRLPCGRQTFQWRNNGHDSVSNHQPHHCLLHHLFSRRSKKTSKLRVTGLCAWNSPGTGEFPAQLPVTQKMCPFDDVIRDVFIPQSLYYGCWWRNNSEQQHWC